MTAPQHQPLMHAKRQGGNRIEVAACCACGWRGMWTTDPKWAHINLVDHLASNRVAVS